MSVVKISKERVRRDCEAAVAEAARRSIGQQAREQAPLARITVSVVPMHRFTIDWDGELEGDAVWVP